MGPNADSRELIETERLGRDSDCDLFAGVEPVEPSAELRRSLGEFYNVGARTLLARCVYFVGPILVELVRRVPGPLAATPAVAFGARDERAEPGTYNFALARGKCYFDIDGPVFGFVQVTTDWLAGGLGKCATGMVGARAFNARNKVPQPALYGAVTCGKTWQFVKLEGQTLAIDTRTYYPDDLPKVLGILVSIATAPAA